MPVDFGWTLPTGPYRAPGGSENYGPHLRKMLDIVSQHFHSAWMPDHFMQDNADIPEAMVTISYLAGLYPQLFFGTIVLGQGYRNPALLAKMAATFQQLSDGRFILGLGAGWKEDEHVAYGYNFPPTATRIAQMAEVAQICKAMWDPAQLEVTFSGEYYQIKNAICNPKPWPPPPIMIGGAGEKLTLRVVAQYADWWNLVGVPPEICAHKIEVLHRHCADVRRDPADIRKTWQGLVSIAPTRQQAEALIEPYPIWPGDTPIVGTPTEVVAQLQRYIDLGVDMFIVAFTDEPKLTGLRIFAEEVMPRVV